MKKTNLDVTNLYEKFFDNKKSLTKSKLEKIDQRINELEELVFELEKEKMELGRIKNYNDLLQQGFSVEEIREFYNDDNETIIKAEKKLGEHINYNRAMMFGYPANMSKDSPLVSFFRSLESRMYLMNSCGDAYHPGNYRMNNAKTELKIIEAIKRNLGLKGNKYWGYINSGGTEGNFWGLREGITQYKNSVVYCSKDAHYSVAKFLEMLNGIKVEVIDTVNGAIDTKQLFEKIAENEKNGVSAAILLLTLGTTALGSVDDVELIKGELLAKNIPHYIHLDAAMYGGIPNNQIDSPSTKIFEKLEELNIDSISISLHKYIGNHKVNGILLAQNQSVDNFIDYIGQRDISILGSRDLAPFSTLQRIKELYDRTPADEYSKNVKYFEELLNKKGVSFIKGHEFGNTFVIEKPSAEICKKYQLATFKHEGKDVAHIIIFPYHTEESMNTLIDEIILDKEK